MDLDYLLIFIGIVSCISAIGLVVYLVISKKRSKFYQDLLRQDTEIFDAYTSTISQLSKTNPQYAEDTVMLDYENADDTILIESDDTVFLSNDLSDKFGDFGLDISILEGKYIIEKEIYGGGMSRVFLVTNTKLGNQWVLKYIEGQ